MRFFVLFALRSFVSKYNNITQNAMKIFPNTLLQKKKISKLQDFANFFLSPFLPSI